MCHMEGPVGNVGRTIAVAAIGALMASLLAASGVAAQSFPGYGYSYYMKTTDTGATNSLGCVLGNKWDDGSAPQDNLAVLIYGQALRSSSGTYGASAYGGSGGFASVTEIKNAVYELAHGFATCIAPNTTAHLQIAVATTNSGDYPNMTTSQITAHGAAWANMVDAINAMILAAGFNSRVAIVGGNDLELDWGVYDRSKAWTDGYHSAASSPYYDVGSADGCPPYGGCDNGWSQARVYQVAYGNVSAWPVPQVYTGSGSQAAQWEAISLWATKNSKPSIWFLGALTEYGRNKATNPPATGGQQLYDAINGHGATAGSVRWSTDMRSYYSG
jgi:hypothetical protein